MAPELAGFLLAQDVETLWLVQDPSTIGLAVAGVVAAAALAALAFLLRGGEDDEQHEADLGPVSELRRIERSRQALLVQLESSPPYLRGALKPLLDGPLRDLDARVQSLLATAAAPTVRAPAALELERQRLEAELAVEQDPRARALLEASLNDLRADREVRDALARNRRLAQLELSRMRTLLDALPARIRELASRQGLERGDASDVEGIAQQLELAVRSTQDVLEGVAADEAKLAGHPEPA